MVHDLALSERLTRIGGEKVDYFGGVAHDGFPV
jgi:hypothetical protein